MLSFGFSSYVKLQRFRPGLGFLLSSSSRIVTEEYKGMIQVWRGHVAIRIMEAVHVWKDVWCVLLTLSKAKRCYLSVKHHPSFSITLRCAVRDDGDGEGKQSGSVNVRSGQPSWRSCSHPQEEWCDVSAFQGWSRQLRACWPLWLVRPGCLHR